MNDSPNPHPMQLVAGASLAGAVMNERSRQYKDVRRPYTGRINGKRRRKFSLIRLPDGTVGELLGATRGKVFVRWTDPTQIDPVQLGWIWERDVTYMPLPAARELGRRKAGVKERKSARKAASARRNGACPCGPGKRRGPKKRSRDQTSSTSAY